MNHQKYKDLIFLERWPFPRWLLRSEAEELQTPCFPDFCVQERWAEGASQIESHEGYQRTS